MKSTPGSASVPASTNIPCAWVLALPETTAAVIDNAESRGQLPQLKALCHSILAMLGARYPGNPQSAIRNPK